MTISDRPDDGVLVEQVDGFAASIEDLRPNLGCETDEPSLGEMVLNYYRRYFLIGEAFNLKDKYFAALASAPANTAQVAPDGCFAAGIEAAALVADNYAEPTDTPSDFTDGFETAARNLARRIRALSASPAQVASAPDRAGVDVAEAEKLADRLADAYNNLTPGAIERADLDGMAFAVKDAANFLAALSATPSREGEVS